MPRKEYKATPEQIAKWRAYDRAYYRIMKEKVFGWYEDFLQRKNRGHLMRMQDPVKRAAYAKRKSLWYQRKKVK